MSAERIAQRVPPGPLAWWRAVRVSAGDHLDEAVVRWRFCGALFVASAAVGFAGLVAGADFDARFWRMAAIGVVVAILGAAWILAAHRMPRGDGWLSGVIGLATAITTLTVIVSDTTHSPWAYFYVSPAFFAFLTFHGRTGLAHALAIACCYAGALAIGPDAAGEALVSWAMLVTTVVLIGLFAHGLRASGERLIVRLRDAAETDALTGLTNRRAFDAAFAREIDVARATGRQLSVIVADLDHFKTVNDRHGHQRGDEVLRAFAVTARETVRRIDAVARIGGEEFAVLLPGTRAVSAHLVAERMRRRTGMGLEPFGHGLSVSFGVASYPEHGETAEELARSADQALYFAKRNGRNRTVVHGPEVAEAQRAEHRATDAQLPAVLALAETLDLRGAGTRANARVAAGFAEAIAAGLGLDPDRVERIRLAALLHDIGKVGLPDAILRNAGSLSDSERAEMQRHPELGARILAGAGLEDIATWVLAHKERVDGLGVPGGLRGDEIPLEARILAVAGSYEAMTSGRPGRPAVSREEAAAEMRRDAGTRYDPAVVAVLFAALRHLGADRDAAATVSGA